MGSYHLADMISFILSLPATKCQLFPRNREIFILDDYSVHLDPQIGEELEKKGYLYTTIGGRITGEIQGGDTHYHQLTKNMYREREMELMLAKLENESTKIPTPSRDVMMRMFDEAWNDAFTQIDNKMVFKQNMITISIDGSEDIITF